MSLQKLKDFFSYTPKEIDVGIALAICIATICLSAGLGLAVGRSSKTAVGEDWLVIENQAEDNQESLENSIELNKLQQAIIKQQARLITDFANQYNVGDHLAKQAEFSATLIPDESIEKLEQQVLESEDVLENHAPN